MTTPLASFSAEALQIAKLQVVQFTGNEALSRPYRFTLTLMGEGPAVDGAAALNTPVSLTLQGDDVSRVVHGVVTQFEVLQQAHGHTFYKLRMEPRLARLILAVGSQIFLDKSVPECIVETLRKDGLTPPGYCELRLQKKYPPREFVLQYNESPLQFISRWMEREGLYYFFEQGETREKLVITDSKIAHVHPLGAKPLRYAPPSGLAAENAGGIVTVFSRSHSLTPRTVQIKDYNYLQPELPIQAQKTVNENGFGAYYSYADNAKSVTEAEHLAAMRAEALGWPWLVARGESDAVILRCGRLFTLEQHYEKSWNIDYCVIQASHEGRIARYLSSGLDNEPAEEAPFYRVTFEAIPADVQYRSPESTAWPRIHGALNARIDAAGSGQYAELDEHGRYKVTLPLDRSGRKDGHGSHYIRKAQPYGGAAHGMHFPLHKGAEVLLTFVDGDPDRPIIAGAVPDGEHPSQVAAATQTQCRLTTAGQNKLHVEDAEGKQRMLLSTPTAETYLRIGAHNDPPPDWSDSGDMAGWKLNTTKAFNVEAGSKNSIILGNAFSFIGGLEARETAGLRFDIVRGGSFALKLSEEKEIAVLKNALHVQLGYFGLAKTSVIAQETLVAETHFKAAAEHIEMVTKKVLLAQTATSASLSRTKLAGSKTAMAQTQSELAQQKTTLTGTADQLASAHQEVAQTSFATAMSKSDLAAAQTVLAQQDTEVLEDMTLIAGDQIAIMEEASKVCETLAEIAAEQNDM